MYGGLALTVLATIVPYVDHATGNALADHIRAGYPTYTASQIHSAAIAWLVILSVVGALGIACWAATIWAVKAGKRWAGVGVATVFVLGTTVALTELLIRDTSGDVGLPPLLGWVGILPCLAGLLAVTEVWSSRRS
jgi:hypothetical protein